MTKAGSGLSFLYFRQLIFYILILKPIFWLFFNFKVFGKNNIKGINGPLIIVSNHKSFLDSFAIAVALPLSRALFPIRIMGMTENFKSGILNTLAFLKIIKILYWCFGVFPAIHGVDLNKSLQKPKKILLNKGAVLIHPEGRVVKEFTIQMFKRGAAALAQMTNSPVLPVALRIVKRKEKMRPFYIINIGPPSYLPSKASFEENSEILRRFVIKLYQKVS